MKTINYLRILISPLLACSLNSCNLRSVEQVLIGFEKDPSSLTDSSKTLSSFSRKDNFFVLNYVGDYNDKVQWLQDYFDIHAGRDFKPNPSGCSVFYATTDSNQNFLGQNVDLPECSVLFGKYSPPGKYKSFSFSRIEDMQGFNKDINPSNLTDIQKACVLFFPFYAVGGMNEHGLAVGIAGIPSQMIKETEKRNPIFVTNFIRQLLDNCSSLDEAIKLSHQYYIFDHSLSTISHHFLIGDSLGHCVIIEYKNGKMDYVFSDKRFQLFTNNNIIDNSIDNLKQCWRFKIINKQLCKTHSNFKIQDYISTLKRATNNTNWSVVFDLKNKQGVFTLYGNFSRQYEFGF